MQILDERTYYSFNEVLVSFVVFQAIYASLHAIILYLVCLLYIKRNPYWTPNWKDELRCHMGIDALIIFAVICGLLYNADLLSDLLLAPMQMLEADIRESVR